MLSHLHKSITNNGIARSKPSLNNSLFKSITSRGRRSIFSSAIKRNDRIIDLEDGEESMSIFNRKAKNMQKDRIAMLPNGRDFDFLREEIGQRLCERLEDLSRHKFEVALDLGCGPGLLAKHLQDTRTDIKKLFQMDSSSLLLNRDIELDNQLPNFKPIRIVGDEEYLPFADSSLDLVISNMSLHWVNDLPATFHQIKRALRPDGLFLASMLGGDTLQELRSAFTLAELERNGGVSPHVSPFAGMGDVGSLLTKAKFALTTVDTEYITVKYADPFILMRDLQGMGENNAVLKSRGFTSKETMLSAASIYESLYGLKDGGIPVTFQIIYLIGWAPDKGQQQPKKRGSATVSLKTLEDENTK
eukprot:TRINITY_DN5775_c0_g1_i1.p1 TRINITY_DN5775_c0_g1~~TRINITY_DN5775_c0_g1_i1.p1  ORF type:complete len:360 (+),score=106.88 TRINITY_DN5775_c0_g1_i1:129-1208(+)